jgi:SAM-dependent methyltransferase
VPRTKKYVVSDIDPEHLARLASRFQHRPNVQVCFADLGRAACFHEFSGQMDSVVCLNVLEHIEDDLAGLRNIHSVLQPGGRAIVLVPHDQKIYGTLDAALGHYRRYSEPELREKMQATGFRVQDVLKFNRISRPPWYVSGKLLKSTALGRTQMRLFDSLVWLWRRIDPALPWPPVSLIAIGVKE